LQEACLADPFSGIRCNLKKTAFACYWSEIANHWLEESRQQERLFNLYTFAMKALAGGNISEETLSILFQIRFLTDAGFSPALETCRHCRRALDSISQDLFWGDLPGGGIRCPLCRINDSRRLKLTKGTIKKLIWMKEKPVETAARVRFSPPEESECLEFLNAFLGYHLGKKLQSLEFLRTLKKDKKTAVNRRCGMIMETAG
jgi:DNA repair protein RecO (recombination protein O)